MTIKKVYHRNIFATNRHTARMASRDAGVSITKDNILLYMLIVKKLWWYAYNNYYRHEIRVYCVSLLHFTKVPNSLKKAYLFGCLELRLSLDIPLFPLLKIQIVKKI